MNVFDIVTIIALVWALISGWRSGFFSQLLSLAGIVAGLVLAVKYGAAVGTTLGIDPQFAAVAGLAIVFVGSVIAATLVAWFLRKVLSALGLGSLDTLFGILLSELKALLVLCVCYSAFASLNSEMKLVEQRHLDASATFGPICNLTDTVMPVVDWAKRQIPAICDAGEQAIEGAAESVEQGVGKLQNI